MKTKILLVLIMASVLLGCGGKPKKQYGNCKEAFDKIKDFTYDELVKAWGEPDDKRESIEDSEVYATWGPSKVKFSDANKIELLFHGNVVHLEAVSINVIVNDKTPSKCVCGDDKQWYPLGE